MSKKRLLIIDAAEKSFVGLSWKAGVALFRKNFDVVVEATTVDVFYDTLDSFKVGQISEAQLWGHGSPGRPLIASKSVDENHPSLDALKGARIWFRSCNVMQGTEGHKFAEILSGRGIDSFGHLALIGNMAMQSYLVGLRDGQKPWWSENLKPSGSAPWAPRTVTALTMNLPSWAFEKDRRLM